MTSPRILTQLGDLHQMMRSLLQEAPADQANRCFGPQLASLGWYLGRSVYRETYWLREVLTGDTDLTDRVRLLFTPGAMDPGVQSAHLPPPDHLLAWAAEIQDEHLRRLATPGEMPASDLLRDDRLQWFLLQEAARDYERMLMVRHSARIRQSDQGYRVATLLTARIPAADSVAVEQGYYRIGSRHEPFAYDNELPPQAVELTAFRIAKRPVSNGEFLAFIEAGGYGEDRLWSASGRSWRDDSGATAPLHWCRDGAQCWYGIGLQGPMDLSPDEPVARLSQHEAEAFAAWVAGLGGDRHGAMLQHEYQWEVAARSGLISGTGQVWEWCANPFRPYARFSPFPDSSVSQADFDSDRFSLRGASLHTQRCLRRVSFRNRAAPSDRHGFTGMRLVFPPSG